MHRIVLRGNVHSRQRPENSRFGGALITDSLKLRDITAENKWTAKDGNSEAGWLGETWVEDYNMGNLPTLNQISNGLVEEEKARLQVILAMGDIKD